MATNRLQLIACSIAWLLPGPPVLLQMHAHVHQLHMTVAVICSNDL